MPRNTPGFDCRAPRIMAEWMVSIPAKKKDPYASDDNLQGVPITKYKAPPDLNPQPYIEVKPGEPGYDHHREEAKSRLKVYQEGSRYKYCPDSTDILDIRVKGDVITPPDIQIAQSVTDPATGKTTQTILAPEEGVPDRPHWVVSDLTEADVDWLPRRSEWAPILIPPKVPTPDMSLDDLPEEERSQYKDIPSPKRGTTTMCRCWKR